MSHIFISYKRENKIHRDRLLAYLQDRGLSDKEIWYDEKEISGGAEWHELIDEALGHAFLVAVVITQKALESTYVTYEWSCAVAQGTPVLPLIFEQDSNIPDPLRRWQCEDCTAQIPEKVFVTVAHHREVSSLTIFSARRIFEQFIPLMIYIRICLWTYELSGYRPNQYGQITNLISGEVNHLTTDLMPNFWLNHSHALTTKQKLRYRYFETVCQDVSHLVARLGPVITQPTNSELPLLFEQLKSHLFTFYDTEVPNGHAALRDWEIIAQYFHITDDQFKIALGDPFATHKNDFDSAQVSKVIESYLSPHGFQIVRNLVESIQANYNWRN